MIIGTANRRTGGAVVFTSALAFALASSAIADALKSTCAFAATGCAQYLGERTGVSGPEEIDDSDGRVHALFDFSSPDIGPFPSDYFTVADAENITGRRLNLPYPDCDVYRSDCDDLAVVNTLDGFGLQTRISIPFDGQIDPATVNSQSMFLIRLPSATAGASVIGINQIVWDVASRTLHVETDALLEQHQRYAVIVTRKVLDTTGVPVKATKEFRHLRTDVAGWYRDQLLEALGAAAQLGVNEQDVVVASVYTTQSVTSAMEKIRDQIKASTPEPANLRLGPLGELAVFNLANVASISWQQHNRLNRDGFATAAIDLAVLQVVPGAIGTIAYGYYLSPDYHVHPGEYIPAVGTRTGTPLVQGDNKIYFTLLLPSSPKPAGGWPIALIGGGTSGNQHFTSGNFASKLAASGIATIGINHVGQGFGPLSTLTVGMSDGSSMTIPDAGRGIDQNGDNIITNTEGSEAAGTRAWTIGSGDAHRQTVIDLMQLVRVIEVGMDVDGDNVADIDPSRISFVGASAGSMIGTIFMALDPSVPVGVAAVTPGVIPEHARWQTNRRPMIGRSLEARTPSLINAPGLTQIDGVAVAAPHFNENKPLRNQPPVINTIEGATEIQWVLELSEMASQAGLSPAMWARHLREAPLPGLYPKSVIYQFATGDQQAVNPGTTAVLRAGNLADWTLYYRHDLAFAQDPSVPKNPHVFAGSPTNPTLFGSISRGAQDQIGAFLASGGTVVIHPEPAYFFEVPITSPLPETLNFIP
jgi:Bacterial virulence factor lipase N-terminal